ncbi:PHD finger protein 20-like protein 1 [Eurosta solidaginis]|uniref:PHD finger protein 20-like protein 1 n=1 Tax=Eurosta solidaginis TaxID=178769 RepID=UPI003530DB56
MGRRCCVAGCSSTSRLPEHHGVTYHSFPLDPNIRAVWLRNTRLSAERQITKSVLVCSRHFRRVDFQPQRSGKYLLKQKVFPTVFPWGKVDPSQVEADLEELKTGTTSNGSQSIEDATTATVEAKVAQIMAETAERSAAKANACVVKEDSEIISPTISNSASPAAVKFEPVTSFNPGARLEAQDFDGIWHAARVVEVDNDDREVLIKFERSGKIKSAVVGTEEWIPMNSSRLRQKLSTKPIPVFELEEKCMARWTGPRKFPGTIKKILGNDMYEVLFDDGYIKNVRAVHMNKVSPFEVEQPLLPELPTIPTSNIPQEGVAATFELFTPVKMVKVKSPLPLATTTSGQKKRAAPGTRKDWPLLDLSKLDFASLNLPQIPQDGEWTCHWVNDQPIGREGYLVVGEHRKPTVIVEDWRLPPGWVKHMYQRSNVLGKWDVILVNPGGKRFRSKSDLKTFLEEQGQVYNPDIYDFSIHRRRAKDINAYVYTPDYTPQLTPKPKLLDSTIATMDAVSVNATTTALSIGTSQYIEAPVTTAVPPAELMTPTLTVDTTSKSITVDVINSPDNADTISARSIDTTTLPLEDGYAYIGGLKVQIIDNLFRCPQQGCLKNFRKEDHLQIHVKHYHQDLIKLLGACPKMLELAKKRTHIKPDQHEPAPRNQIPNQQFFAKLYQQDLLQTRAHRRTAGLLATTIGSISQALETSSEIKSETEFKIEPEAVSESAHMCVVSNDILINSSAQNSTVMDISSTTISSLDDGMNADISVIPRKRPRTSTNKRGLGARKSNRQRTTRRYLTAAQATSSGSMLPVVTADSSFGVSEFEETRHSFNGTPDAKVVDGKKRKSSGAAVTPMSSLDSPVTADSGSSSFPPLLAPGSNEAEAIGGMNVNQPQYIKENGELIKIVSMRQEEIINCLCSYGEEDGLMIQCELCLCWQHGICNGIDKEGDVPEKYVCYICRNPQRGREAMRFKHDQDWLYDGKLPVANYHIPNPNLQKRFDFLKKSHVLTGNLVELKRFMHSLRVKINIANNRCHPKLYLWAKKWEDDLDLQTSKSDIKSEQDIKVEDTDVEMKTLESKCKTTPSTSPTKKIKSEPTTPSHLIPNVPQPEAPIDPVECQHRLMEHIKIQQSLVLHRLDDIEKEMEDLERQDDIFDLRDADLKSTKDVVATFIKELDTMKQLAKLNILENTKQSLKNTPAPK